MRSNIVTLLTDFGTRDPYAGIVKGVILGINPQANIVDLVQEADPHDIRQAGFLLASSAGWFPDGTVHMAVVDPGVGGSRRCIAVQCEHHFYVGPDNGVFTRVFMYDRPIAIVELRPGNSSGERIARVSNTFHGRDVFAPAAACLSKGVPLENLGTLVDSYTVDDIDINVITESKIQTFIVHADVFGNLVTCLRRGETDRRVVSVRAAGINIPLRETFSEVEEGGLLAYWGSADYLEIAVNLGSARKSLGLSIGDPVEVLLD